MKQGVESAADGGGKDTASETFALTPVRHFTLDYFHIPMEMSPYIATLYHYRCDEKEIRDIQPAAIGHLTIFPYGVGEMRFVNGQRDPSNEVNLVTPYSVAAPFVVDGPFHSIGVVLTPLGWAALTGLDACKHGNRLYRAADWLGEEVEVMGKALCAAYRAGEKSGPECALALSDYIANNLKPVNERHTTLIKTVTNWLSSDLDPPLDELYEQVAYSRRQVQRLVERYFGLPPQALLRKYRALRAAGLLSLPKLSPEFEAKLGEAFYDQSHMIREIRLFAGRTPTRLTDKDSPYLIEVLDLKNFAEIDPLGPDDPGRRPGSKR